MKRARAVVPMPTAEDPCRHCPHILRRHAAQEGMCLDCKCYGWAAR